MTQSNTYFDLLRRKFTHESNWHIGKNIAVFSCVISEQYYRSILPIAFRKKILIMFYRVYYNLLNTEKMSFLGCITLNLKILFELIWRK
jgi:hypothetical protein